MMITEVSVSVLSANPLEFGQEIKRIERSGAEMIHYDVMDGIFVNNITFLGRKEIVGSRTESRILTRKGAKLFFNGGTINYGADIEVFQDAELYLGKGIAFNINATIICGSKIYIDSLENVLKRLNELEVNNDGRE